MLDRGFTAHTQLQYSGVPHPYRRRTSTFQGPHGVLTIKRMKNRKGVIGFLVSDPLKYEPIFWPEDVMKKAAFQRSGNGYIDAAYLPLDMNDRPGSIHPPVKELPPEDEPPPESDIDDLPVPEPEPEPSELDLLKGQLVAADELIVELRNDAGEVRELALSIAEREIP